MNPFMYVFAIFQQLVFASNFARPTHFITL